MGKNSAGANGPIHTKNGGGKILTIGPQSRNVCQLCGQSHPAHTKCHYDALTRRVMKLIEANQIIPALMSANSEATELAKTFQKMAHDAAKALSLCEEVVKGGSWDGEEIWAEFEKRLEASWATGTTSQGTGELRDQAGKSTSSETSDKPSTEETTPGETTPPDSLPLTVSATPAANGQQ